VTVSSTGTSLLSVSALSEGHLPSAFGAANQVNTKSAVFAEPVAGDKALSVN